jgi:hypothetical protein
MIAAVALAVLPIMLMLKETAPIAGNKSGNAS